MECVTLLTIHRCLLIIPAALQVIRKIKLTYRRDRLEIGKFKFLILITQQPDLVEINLF